MPASMEATETRLKAFECRGAARRTRPVRRGWLSKLVAVLVPQEAIFADLHVYKADVLKDLRYGTE
jgi:hypothetical protein